jgi:hypothetical protein
MLQNDEKPEFILYKDYIYVPQISSFIQDLAQEFYFSKYVHRKKFQKKKKKKGLKRDILNKSIFQYIKSNKKSNKYH